MTKKLRCTVPTHDEKIKMYRTNPPLLISVCFGWLQINISNCILSWIAVQSTKTPSRCLQIECGAHFSIASARKKCAAYPGWLLLWYHFLLFVRQKNILSAVAYSLIIFLIIEKDTLPQDLQPQYYFCPRVSICWLPQLYDICSISFFFFSYHLQVIWTL